MVIFQIVGEMGLVGGWVFLSDLYVGDEHGGAIAADGSSFTLPWTAMGRVSTVRTRADEIWTSEKHAY